MLAILSPLIPVSATLLSLSKFYQSDQNPAYIVLSKKSNNNPLLPALFYYEHLHYHANLPWYIFSIIFSIIIESSAICS